MRDHLYPLPSPRATGVVAIDSAALLARRAARGDHRATAARLMLVIAEKNGIIADLRDELDRANEAGEALLARLAELEDAALRRPSRLEAWWGALCLAWWETDPARSPRWAWPSLVAFAALALALVRW